LKTTLQFCKANTPFEVEEREKRREKNCRRSSMLWMATCAGHHVEGTLLWTVPQKATNDHWEVPLAPPKKNGSLSLVGACSASVNHFFFNYRKIRTPLTPRDNCKKTNVKRPKVPLDLKQKKLTPRTIR
jgi:hypothetical protein